LLERLPLAVLLINDRREILYANPAVGALLKVGGVPQVIGLRIGQAVGCQHGDEAPDGCGTTDYCTNCGANRTLRAGQRGEHATDECRIVSKTLGHDLDLRVTAEPIVIGGAAFTLFAMSDISREKRREALERVFFHDILNTAGGIQGLASLCEGASASELAELIPTVARLAGQLIDELKMQQNLTSMETGELAVIAAPLSSTELLETVAGTYRNHEVATGRRLSVDADSHDVTFVSDGTLLGRVLGNLTKNALEACPRGGVVTLRAEADVEHVRFSVHSPSAMPRDVQLQIFQRSFSTKGVGRGLGTYSVKLLTERYLNGHVLFTSSEEDGTTFVTSYPRHL
jgi:signal transduction histidine kinase